MSLEQRVNKGSVGQGFAILAGTALGGLVAGVPGAVVGAGILYGVTEASHYSNKGYYR